MILTILFVASVAILAVMIFYYPGMPEESSRKHDRTMLFADAENPTTDEIRAWQQRGYSVLNLGRDKTAIAALAAAGRVLEEGEKQNG